MKAKWEFDCFRWRYHGSEEKLKWGLSGDVVSVALA